MRITLSAVYLASLLVGFSESAPSLRRGDKGGWELQVDLSEHRELSSTFENNKQLPGCGDDDPGSDAALLNEIIRFFLPTFNQAFQASVPDPLDLPFVGSFQLPEIDILACKAQAAFDFDLGEILGLSGMSIESLSISPGTEDVNAGCFETLFSAVFDMTIASASLFSLEGLAAGFSANACGVPFDDSVTGGVETFKPTMRGATSISGLLLGNLATITFAENVQVLEVGYDTIEGYLNQVPPQWNLVIRNATSQLSEAMKSELVTTVEPEANKKSQESMRGQSVEIDTATAMRIRSRFMRNKTRRQVNKMYQDTANFFGSAAGFLGFGKGQEGGD